MKILLDESCHPPVMPSTSSTSPMKILLNESCPRKLRNDFGPQHDVWTVLDKGWLGQKNGALLALMVADNFELLITVDRNLPYQQFFIKLQVPIFVLCAANKNKTPKK